MNESLIEPSRAHEISVTKIKGAGIDIGVQAGDELIKVANDRVRLIEKSRHMFFGKNTQAGD